jgi:hypothetical protein
MDEPDPLTSAGRQAERDAFAAKGRRIWAAIAGVIVLIIVGVVLLFR